MGKVDIKDAYYSVLILAEQQKYLEFQFRRKFCQFTYLPNGFGSSPHKFTKLLKPPLSYLRLQQVTVLEFIDNLINLGRSFVKCERNIKLILTLLDLPRSIEYFGFEIDSQLMNIILTQKKAFQTVMSVSPPGRISDHQKHCQTTG